MKALRRAYLGAAYYFAVTVFVIASFTISIVCSLLWLLPGSKVLKRPLRAALQFLFRRWAWFMGFIRVLDLTTPAKTPRKSDKGEIWIMNHPSLLDGSYLLKFITNGTCIYKREIGFNPLYAGSVRLADYIPNLGGVDMVRMAKAALERGEDLVIFPEGTRSTEVNVDNFRPGFALIAKRSRAPVNVMWMESPDDFMTKEAPVWKVPELTAQVTISQIGRLEPSEYRSVQDLLDAAKNLYRKKSEQGFLGCPYPKNTCIDLSEESAESTFRLQEDFAYFDGHFPGNPIVPAVVQIGWAKVGVEAFRGRKLVKYRLSRFKFIRPIRPNNVVRVLLEKLGTRYRVQVFADDELCSSGVVTTKEDV